MVASLAAPPTGPAEAREGNKTLKLYFGHTKERGEFTFKRNGRYDKKEIARINRFLRDWRRNEPANMDPQLLDLVHAIYRDAGGRDYIHVVSAYRSLQTNNALRSRSRGVAQKSQHTAGRAIDFYIPGVPLAKLRASAMKFQRGGVGYYPTSGSPFVHVDTGSVRYWPRMSRKQLLALFPNGETMYLPSDGKPLPGYERAVARSKSSGGTALAYLETGEEKSGKSKGNWLKRVFSGGADEAEDNEATATAAAPQPAAPPPAAPAVEPPAGEPQMLIAAAEEARPDARLPKARPAQPDMMMASLQPDLPADPAVSPPASAILAPPGDVPLPRSRPDAQLLADTLRPGTDAPGTLAVDPQDAIALLSLSSESAPPPADPAPPAQVAALTPDAGKAGPTEADLAAIDAFTAIDGATDQAGSRSAGPQMPRPRPVALAFAGSGLPAAEVPRRSQTPAQAPAAALQPAALPLDPRNAAKPKGDMAAVHAVEIPAYDADQDGLQNLLQEPATSAAVEAPAPKQAVKGDFGGFAMPEPARTPELFTPPPSAAAVAPAATPALPTDRFQPTAAKKPPEDEQGFFSKLFASLAS